MYSGSAVRAKTIEELWTQFEPFIYKYTHNNGYSRFAKNGIPGYDVEDFEQEAYLILYRCQQSFMPEDKDNVGHAGKRSSFMNFLASALDNRWAKLRAATDKFHRPVQMMICANEPCSTKVPPAPRAKCPSCGGQRWIMERSQLDSLDTLLVEPVGESGDLSTVNYILDELPKELLPSIMRLLSGEDTAADRRNLAKLGQRDDLSPELQLLKAIREGKSVRSAELPAGYDIEVVDGRQQPYTIWKGDRIIGYAESYDRACSRAQSHAIEDGNWAAAGYVEEGK